MKNNQFMQMALNEAKKGTGKTLPNPLVGAVIVKNGKVISKGYHKYFGGKHAEVNAIEKAGKKAIGATMFVTLEPCNHFGKQPPCAPAVLKAGIKEIFIASHDPNQKGKGIKYLKKNKVKVNIGLMEKEALELNKEFFKFLKTGRPFVTLKTAVSLDGKITFGNEKRKQIASNKSLQKVYHLRKQFQGIMVGKNTVLKDNPNLTSREKITPTRIILCSDAKLPDKLNIFSKEAKTIIVCTKKAKEKDIQKLLNKEVGVLVCKEKKGYIDLQNLLTELGKANIASVLVEAGQEVFTSFVKENLFDEIILIISPKVIGEGKFFVKDEKLLDGLKPTKTKEIDGDLWVWLEKK